MQAQAVAARSYALSHRVTGKPFDLYADVRSQVYGGIRGEHPRTTAAVQATKGQVLLWEGKPIDALFHSTSGGSTLAAAEVFGKAVPYLVGVDDPWSALSPVHRWGPTPVPETALRKGLALRTPVTGLQPTRGASGRVVSAQVATATGTTQISGTALRRAGGLRSTWVTELVTMSLTRPGGPVTFGKTVALTGRAKGVKGAVLQQRVDGVWTTIAGPALKAKVKLVGPASFRIAAGTLAGSVLKVPVAPLVTVRAGDRMATGTVMPLDPGTTVELQREGERGWSTMAQTTTGPEGEFSIALPNRAATAPGSRRRRASPRASRAGSSCDDAACTRPRRCGRARAAGRSGPLRHRRGDRERSSRLRAALPDAESLAPIPALVVERTTPPSLRDLPGATYVERLGARRPAYVPNDLLAAKQWHLEFNRTFDFWETPTPLAAVRVAVIDSGIDGDHPDFAGGKIADAKTFVGGSARVDEEGHGTFVAGLIAAGVNNSVGIAGSASSAELLVAKVVDDNDLIDVEAEVKAIRWAVRRGARVINMSLGGFRDPRDPDRDAFSALEAQAIGWAHGEGAVVVAAVGNNTDVPPRPWPYASYPAALPHVLGVSALARDGSVPVFSHRDKIYTDIAAPGVGILSTFPRALTAETKECAEQGYSSCASDDFRKGQGTSFAAPQVSAAAAVLLAVRPKLRPEQVAELVTRTAQDVNGATGCPGCALQRDALTGWGRLDVNAALKQL